MDYLIPIFGLGLIVTFVVVVGLARAAEFARSSSAERLEIDSVPEDLELVPTGPTDEPPVNATTLQGARLSPRSP